MSYYASMAFFLWRFLISVSFLTCNPFIGIEKEAIATENDRQIKEIDPQWLGLHVLCHAE